MVLSVIGINSTSEWVLIARDKVIRPFMSAVVTLLAALLVLGDQHMALNFTG